MNRLHRVLVVGVGSIGERHVRCFQGTGRAEVSICEANGSLCDEVAGRYAIKRSFVDLATALSEQHDAAVIATPANSHIPLAQLAAEAGLHLLIEKPLSISIDGVHSLQETVSQRELVAAVAYVYRANPVLAGMRQAIRSGRFGRPLELIAVSGQHFPTYRPAYRNIYYNDHATGGGAIQDAMTHVVNASEWMVGPIDRLVADAAHQRLEGVDVEDTVHLLARHGQLLASYSLNQHQSPNENTITIVCDNGTARFVGHQNRWRSMDRPDSPWRDEAAEPIERDTLFIRQAEAFLDAIERTAAPRCTINEALQTLCVNLATLTSIASGTWCTVSDH